MLKLDHVTKYYDKFLAVDDISFEIEEGEMFDISLTSISQKKSITKLDNGKFLVKIPIPEKYNGKKLTKFILDSFPHLSPNMLYKALRQKDIKIDGARTNKDCTIYEESEILTKGL